VVVHAKPVEANQRCKNKDGEDKCTEDEDEWFGGRGLFQLVFVKLN